MREKCNEKGVQTAIMPSQVNNREEQLQNPFYLMTESFQD